MLGLEVRKELRKAVREAKEKIISEQRKRMALINRHTDFAMLEEFIQSVNNNPGLVIEFTTAEGTTVKLKTVENRRKTYTEILGDIDG